MEAMVTPAPEQSSRLRLNVLHDGKEGIFTRWEDSPIALSQNAKNQLRVVKNALKILWSPTLSLRCRHHRQDPIQTAQPFDRACAGQCRESLRL